MIKLYLVLSVAECQRLLNTACRSALVVDNPVNKNHCIVLDLEASSDIVSKDGRMQISSSSFGRAIELVESATLFNTVQNPPSNEVELSYSGV
jgi:hypothetical protein